MNTGFKNKADIFKTIITTPGSEQGDENESATRSGTGEVTGEVAGEATGEVKRLLVCLKGEMKRGEIQDALGLKGEDHFRNAYLKPAIEKGWVEMTQPDSSKSPTQKYRLTANGQNLLKRLK